MESLLQDLRYGLRVLRQNPGFTAVAVLTLAIGIGSNTVLFSLVNSILLNPLRYPQPERLVALYSKTQHFKQGSISYPNLLDWQKQNRSFEIIAGNRPEDFNLTGMGEPERLHGHMIDAGFFALLGDPPLMGREFTPQEDQVGAAPVALLGDGLWKRKFGSSRDVLGRVLNIGGEAYTIVGVVPHHVAGLTDSDIYVPLGQWNDPTFRDRRVPMGTSAVARLKPGVTLQQAQADMDAVSQQLATAYPDANAGWGVTLVPLKQDVVGDTGRLLLILLGAVGFVLLIACANVANLLLARSTGRAREFAIRAAMGANQRRLVRQLLTESLLLSLTGGVLGLGLATWGTRAVLAALPSALPRADEVALDSHVLLFTFLVCVIAGVLFGLAPAWRTSRPDLHGTLKEGGRGLSASRHRVQTSFVVAETALALVLLAGAGLMLRSLVALWGSDVGFDPSHVLTFNVSFLPQKAGNPAQIRANHRALVDHFQSVPGVSAAAEVVGSLPMQGDSELPFWIDGTPKPPTDTDMSWSLFYGISPGYFKAMGIQLIRGRLLTDQDNEHSPGVIVIDEVLASKFFPGQDPIGKRLNFGLFDMKAEIVGIVRHVNHWGPGVKPTSDIQAEFYLPWVQFPDQVMPLAARSESFVVRTTNAPESMVETMRKASMQFDPSQVAYGFIPMAGIVSQAIEARRFTMIVMAIFAAMALLLASIGIYGVLSYVVGQRIQEMGIRMALGAQPRDVLRLVLGEGTRMALIGVGIGLVLAIASTRLMSSLLYGVSAIDPLTFVAVALLLSVIGILACLVPALRATRVDPMVALRYE